MSRGLVQCACDFWYKVCSVECDSLQEIFGYINCLNIQGVSGSGTYFVFRFTTFSNQTTSYLVLMKKYYITKILLFHLGILMTTYFGLYYCVFGDFLASHMLGDILYTSHILGDVLYR